MKYLKDHVWIICLIAAVFLFLNPFIQLNLPSRATVSSGQQDETVAKLTWPLNSIDGFISKLSCKASANPCLNLPLKLLGTVTAHSSIAFIMDLETEDCGVYKLNDLISGARIMEITLGKVLLQKNGQRQLLLTRNNGRSVTLSKLPAITNILPNVMLVNRPQAIEQIKSVNELLAKIKILPVPDAGPDNLWGLRINNIPAGSVIDEAGIQSGDLIYSIQGQKIESMLDVMRMFRRLRSENEIIISLLRDGQSVTLRYEITN